ncbi:hypothetical protein JKP88DRAFT_251636 [Tribonema minus]|uniref:Uncharacterized protein n=1 Tax=Tribonema minus TaxID=303371 RepID=A0A836CLU1_9STRA|nr:hypothetical protein JKP88DRAFT_251636 [Tribonema minus]
MYAYHQAAPFDCVPLIPNHHALSVAAGALGKRGPGRPRGVQNFATRENERRRLAGLPSMEKPPRSRSAATKRHKKSPVANAVKPPKAMTLYLEGARTGIGAGTEEDVPARIQTPAMGQVDQQLSQISYIDCPATLDSHMFMETNTPYLQLVHQYQTMFVDLSHGAPPRYSCNVMYQDWERASLVHSIMSNCSCMGLDLSTLGVLNEAAGLDALAAACADVGAAVGAAAGADAGAAAGAAAGADIGADAGEAVGADTGEADGEDTGSAASVGEMTELIPDFFNLSDERILAEIGDIFTSSANTAI